MTIFGVFGGKKHHTHIIHFINYRWCYVSLTLRNLVQSNTISQYVASTTILMSWNYCMVSLRHEVIF